MVVVFFCIRFFIKYYNGNIWFLWEVILFVECYCIVCSFNLCFDVVVNRWIVWEICIGVIGFLLGNGLVVRLFINVIGIVICY